MAKVIYNPGSDMPLKTSIFGYDFDGSRNGEPTEVTDPRALAKLRAMQPDKGEGVPGTDSFVPWFEVLDDEASAAGYVAKHVGRGSYAILNGGERVVDKLSKEDADAFNALSDDDKALKVQALKADA